MGKDADGYGVRNCLKIGSALPWRSEYAYVDTPAYRADKIFINAELPVTFRKNELHKDGAGYVIVFCRTKRKDECLFLTCMADLERALLLEGHTDYGEFCEKTLVMFHEGSL